MSCQSLFTLWWMLYAWDHPNRVVKNKSPKTYIDPQLSFTTIVPARNEKDIIYQTLSSISDINYPENLKETIIVCREDDIETIIAVQKAISKLKKNNIRLEIYNDLPINKPHALNVGLKQVRNDIVVIFDAEDTPHREIFNIANTLIKNENSDVLQSGVQLMNYQSNWYSTLNVLEYYFWFKSTLQFFASCGIIPLGGNSVFFRKECLDYVNGWDESCLTEDADIGIKLSSIGAKIDVVYDENHVTLEESPLKLSSFIKQRTRWNQGFIQILLKRDWLKLPKQNQRFLAGYILISPELQVLMLVYIPVAISIALLIQLPVWLSLLTILPILILFLQLITYNIGLYLFTKDYKFKYSLVYVFKILLTYIPYQFVLGLSALRALIRTAHNNVSWEKTPHANAHRRSLGSNDLL